MAERKIYLVNTFRDGQWRTVRWCASLDKVVEVMHRNGFIRRYPDSDWVWEKPDGSDYHNVTFTKLEE